VALTPDGKCAVSGAQDNTLCVWDLEGNQPTRVLEGHTNSVQAVALTPDGEVVVSASDDNTVRVWDLKGNQLPRVLRHSSFVKSVALRADGKRAVSGSHDNRLRVLDLDDGRCVATFTCDAWVQVCAWAAGRIVAGDAAGQIHVLAWKD
jgi:WD40 repeat protein